MFYTILSIQEYSELAGFAPGSTRVHQIIKSGVWPVEWVQPPKKIGNQWVLFVNNEWIKGRKNEN